MPSYVHTWHTACSWYRWSRREPCRWATDTAGQPWRHRPAPSTNKQRYHIEIHAIVTESHTKQITFFSTVPNATCMCQLRTHSNGARLYFLRGLSFLPADCCFVQFSVPCCTVRLLHTTDPLHVSTVLAVFLMISVLFLPDFFAAVFCDFTV
jgi:hypothetical protein